MAFPIKSTVTLLVLGTAGAVAYKPMLKSWKERTQPEFRLAQLIRGEIVSVVNSTGTVKPVLSVQIGSFVSGPILELFVDFNDEVRKGDMLAKIDPRIYEANVARDLAIRATRKADVARVEALLQQAKNDEKRAEALRAENKDYISDTEMDQFKFNRLSLEAQLTVAKSAVKQAEASLENSKASLEYTDITSPVDGIVIDRKIDPGQTLAAQFQTPELFVIAPQMKEKMLVDASVDEADIGLIREAKGSNQPVQFTVDAYPEDLFEGTISEVRFSSTTTQNVVTYPVIVEAPNPELKLLPGMTASISFQIDRREDILMIPNAALRFYPNTELVRPEDRKLLDGTDISSDDDDQMIDPVPSAQEKAQAGRKRTRRHVWIVERDYLKAIEVVTGLSDNKHTEMVSGELEEGQELVTGIKRRR